MFNPLSRYLQRRRRRQLIERLRSYVVTADPEEQPGLADGLDALVRCIDAGRVTIDQAGNLQPARYSFDVRRSGRWSL